MTERHARQGFLGPQAERLLAHTEVTIVGLCGGGSHLAQQLAHIGVGRFNLVDFDRADVSNSNRMVGLDAAAAERKDRKVDVIDRIEPRDSGGFFDWRGDPIAW